MIYNSLYYKLCKTKVIAAQVSSDALRLSQGAINTIHRNSFAAGIPTIFPKGPYPSRGFTIVGRLFPLPNPPHHRLLLFFAVNL